MANASSAPPSQHTKNSANTAPPRYPRRNPGDFTSETGRIAQIKSTAVAEAAAVERESRPASFTGHLPIVLQSAAAPLLPRILSDEISFRSSILDRIAFMEGHIVKALEDKLYSVELASMPTLLREWRQCLELSLRIVEKTKGLNTQDAAVNQVSGLLAKEALLRHELERLRVVDKSGRIITTLEHQKPQTALAAPGATISEPPIPGQPPGPDLLPSGQAGGFPVKRRPGRPKGSKNKKPRRKPKARRAAPRRRGGMTTGSLSAGETDDRQASPPVPSSPPPGSSESGTGGVVE